MYLSYRLHEVSNLNHNGRVIPWPYGVWLRLLLRREFTESLHATPTLNDFPWEFGQTVRMRLELQLRLWVNETICMLVILAFGAWSVTFNHFWQRQRFSMWRNPAKLCNSVPWPSDFALLLQITPWTSFGTSTPIGCPTHCSLWIQDIWYQRWKEIFLIWTDGPEVVHPSIVDILSNLRANAGFSFFSEPW